ncbi:PucR family transcriptional regulator [Microbispora sp. H11081]|uniref:PucR family transcriptional regulator n=1 Tax=Microbispora sp. H11081 TaxID=2729107 RepID=UPI00289E4CD2|nr:PucR family transcriptional regulator [Microbispora sp. H11081]
MAPTLRRITAIVPLHLAVLAGRAALDRKVRWVAVSELEDPTPFLEGGELVLTTGMRLSAADAVPYVSRLVARGVTGLGFGVGLSHEAVPSGFAEAADAAGLPLVEVPRDTPFIAIGKAVSDLLAGEQYEEISRAFAAQGRLTRAALRRQGPVAVVDRLAREIGGWALLLDPSGAVRHAADATGRRAGPAGPRGAVADWAGETARSLEPELARLRNTPSLSSLALATPDEHVVVQPLGRRGFFAVGSSRPFAPIAHTVVNAAGSLLTLALEQGREQRAAAAQVRSAVLRLLLAGEARAAAETLSALGTRLPGEPVTVLACDTPDSEALTEALTGATPRSSAGRRPAEMSGHEAQGPQAAVTTSPAVPVCFTAHWEGLLVVLAPDSRADEIVALAARHGRVGVSMPGVEIAGPVRAANRWESRMETFAETWDDGVQDGVPGPAPRDPDHLPLRPQDRVQSRAQSMDRAQALDLALDQARRALVSASPVARFGELAGRGLLSLIDPAAAASFAAAILAPLREYGSRADLVESLRAYLASNGHWDAAAQRLGVHRHTLRYRMKRVSELLGRDLDDPSVRAELWIALSF